MKIKYVFIIDKLFCCKFFIYTLQSLYYTTHYNMVLVTNRAALSRPGWQYDMVRDAGIAIHNTVRTFYELLSPILKGIHNGNTKYYHAQ